MFGETKNTFRAGVLEEFGVHNCRVRSGRGK